MRSKGEFPDAYCDFIREQGAPEVLRRDNAMEENSEAVRNIHRDLYIKDENSEPHNQQQNPVELRAIRYLKNHSHVIMDHVGAPAVIWFMCLKYLAQIHNICADKTLSWQTPLFKRTGVTQDISAYLLFKFWEPILYLDPEASWPSSKEKTARFLCVAEHIGDALTFWIYDEASGEILARSVVRRKSRNKRVLWDPSLQVKSSRQTASNGGDIMPEPSSKPDMDEYDKMEPDPEPRMFDTNQGDRGMFDDIHENHKDSNEPAMMVSIPKGEETTAHAGEDKLVYSSKALAVDNKIPTLTSCLPVKKEPVVDAFARKSSRVKTQPVRLGMNSRKGSILKALIGTMVTGATAFSNQAFMEPSVPVARQILLSSNFPAFKPIDQGQKTVDLLAYHNRIDMMDQLENPQDNDYIWQPQAILQHLVRRNEDGVRINVKVVWQNGDKAWFNLEDLRIQDPLMAVTYALRNTLLEKPGWEWVMPYVK